MGRPHFCPKFRAWERLSPSPLNGSMEPTSASTSQNLNKAREGFTPSLTSHIDPLPKTD